MIREISYKGVPLYVKTEESEYGPFLVLSTASSHEISRILLIGEPEAAIKEWAKAIRISDALDHICDAWKLWPTGMTGYITGSNA